MNKILIAALKRVTSITKDEAQMFLDGLDGKPKQKDLDDFVKRKQYDEEEISEFMYDLRDLRVMDLEAPAPSKKDASLIPVDYLSELIKYIPDYTAISVEVGDDWGPEGFGPLGNPSTLFTDHPFGSSKYYDADDYEWGLGVHWGDNDSLVDELAAVGYDKAYTTDVGLIISEKDGEEQYVYFTDTDEFIGLEKEWTKWWKEKASEIEKDGQTLVDLKKLPKYPFPDKQENKEAERSD